ncbi:DUF1682-domain-containing protein [Meira miltonrushii]|uniref:DUF1682-domain-containing protein n=1 Tax=Meira miltonrushii TaxID=1280837 RepID=A0A316V6K2_9BASI|nr:DUF1682-domain-containing protein [Meira miltonrushii]PWN32121.1 DUF1682-domain-containing protein [Meira miltonrushii]
MKNDMLLTLLLSTVAFSSAGMVGAVELPGFLKGAIPEQLQDLPWYERSYEFTLIRTPVKVRPIDFKLESLFLGIAFVYFIAHLIGKARNRALAKAWLKTAMPLLEDEFAFVGKEDAPAGHHFGTGEGDGKLVWNGGGEALAYASGRRGVDGLQILFRLTPFHDPFELLYTFLYNTATGSSKPVISDTISLTFLLPFQSPDNISGVFAIAEKSVLRESRQGRFDMTFAKVLDGENVNSQRQLDARYAIMSEVGDLTDAFLGDIGDKGNAQRNRVGLQAALNNSEAGNYLYSLVLSDQPEKRPETGAIPVEKRKRKLVLTLRMPKSQSGAKASLSLVEAACNLVDALELGNAKLNNTTINKLRQTRVAVDKELTEEATKYDREDEEEARQAAKKKAEQEKFDKLSPAEQEKKKQVEKKRQQRKAQGKQMTAR